MLRRDRHEVDRDALLPDVPRAGLRLIPSLSKDQMGCRWR